MARPLLAQMALGGLLYAFLYAPLAVVVIYSFNASRLNAEWVGFTLHWYRELLSDGDMLAAAGNSLLVALACSLLSTLLGTLAALALWQRRQPLLTALVLGPVAVPEVLLGVSLLLAFVLLEVSLGLVSITLAHTVFAIGFVVSFIFAMLAVRALLKFIGNHSYAAFAWYRIAFGLLILATWQFGWIDWSTAQG